MDELRRLSNAATPGPWRVDDDWFIVSVPHEIDDESGMETFDPAIAIAARAHNYPDAAFIEAAVNYIRAALAARSEPGAEGLREALHAAIDDCDSVGWGDSHTTDLRPEDVHAAIDKALADPDPAP